MSNAVKPTCHAVTEREQRLVGMINDLLISLDKIAVSKGMGASRAEAIRAIENYQVYWRRWKEQYISEPAGIPKAELDRYIEGILIPFYELTEKKDDGN